MISHRQFQLLALLPNDVLPHFRRLAVAIGRQAGAGVVEQILKEADAPATFSQAQQVRRVQQQEVLMAIHERTGGAAADVGEWFDRLDGRTR